MAEKLTKVLNYEVNGKSVKKVKLHYRDRLTDMASYSWVVEVSNWIVTEAGDFRPYFRSLAEGVANLTYYTDYFDDTVAKGDARNVDTARALLGNSNVLDALNALIDANQYQQMVDWVDEMVEREKSVSYWDRAGRRAIEVLNQVKDVLTTVSESGIIEKLNDAGLIAQIAEMAKTDEGIDLLKQMANGLIGGAMTEEPSM